MKAKKRKYSKGGKLYDNGGTIPKKMKKKVAKKVGPSQVKRDGSKAKYASTDWQPLYTNKQRDESRGRVRNPGAKDRMVDSLLTPKDQAPPKMRRLAVDHVHSNKHDLNPYSRGLKKNPKALKPSGPSVAAMNKKKKKR